MPRVLPSVGPSSVGVGVHRLLRRRVAEPLAQVDLVEALRRDTLQVELAELLGRGVPHPVAALPRSSRSNEAPANVLRVIRWVRFGAASEYTYCSGWAIDRVAVGVHRARRPGGSASTGR